jgi:hypothetical protein
MEFIVLAHKEEWGDVAPQRAKDDESGGLLQEGPGERLPYSDRSAKRSADTMPKFPA